MHPQNAAIARPGLDQKGGIFRQVDQACTSIGRHVPKVQRALARSARSSGWASCTKAVVTFWSCQFCSGIRLPQDASRPAPCQSSKCKAGITQQKSARPGGAGAWIQYPAVLRVAHRASSPQPRPDGLGLVIKDIDARIGIFLIDEGFLEIAKYLAGAHLK